MADHPDERMENGSLLTQNEFSVDEYRALVESFAQAVWETDATGMVTTDSPSWRAYTGQTTDESLGEGWIQAIHPDDRPYALTQWREAIRQQRPVDAEFRLRSPDGGWRWTNVRATALHNPDGSVRKWVGLNIDISARKAAEAQLQQSESRFRVLSESLPLVVSLAHPDGAIEYINPWWTSFSGRSANDFINGDWLEAVHPDDQPAVLHSWQSALSTGEPYQYEFRARSGNGTYRWLLARGIPIHDNEGHIYRWINTALDIHDRRQSEEKLQLAEANQRTILDSANQSIMLIAPDYSLQLFNRFAAQATLLVFGQQMQVGQSILLYVLPEDQADFITHFQQALTGQEIRVEKSIAGINNSNWWEFFYYPIRQPNGSIGGVTFTARDISDRRRAEATLRESEERLRLATEAADMYAWEIDLRTGVPVFSSNTEQVTGRVLTNSFDQNLQRIHPDDRDTVRGAFAEAANNGTDRFDYEMRSVHDANQLRWYRVSGVLIRDAQAEPTRAVGITQNITARKQSEQALQLSNERFRLAEAASNGFIYDWDLRTGTATRSEGITRVLGYEPDEIAETADAWLALIHPDDQPIKTQIKQLPSGTDPYVYTFEYRVRDRKGNYRYVLDRGLGLRDEAGNVVRVVGSTVDIDQKKRTEDALYRQQERTRIAVEAADMGTWEWNLLTNDVYWNEQHFRLFGMEPHAQPIGPDEFEKRVYPDDHDRVMAALNRTIREHVVYDQEFRARRDDGQLVWMRGYGRVTAQQDGQATRLSGVMFDITERREAEQTLRQSEERFRTLVQNLPDYAIFRIDAAGIVTEWTEGAQRVIGYTADDVIGRSIALFYTPESLAANELTDELEQASRSGRAERESIRVRKGGERFWVNEICTAIRDADGRLTGFTKISRDITQRKEADRALRESDRRKDEFLAMLAHELRNPLAPIRNILQLLDLSRFAKIV